MPAASYARIYEVVRRIPRGRVASYGQVARLAGIPNGARQVGYALHALRDGPPVPWHRVVNALGGISLRGASAATQRRRLEGEGVRFDDAGRVRLARFAWRPSGARRPDDFWRRERCT
jgi:methylated-DNA-protein-cysteine methyltransferase-like protein